MFEETQYLLACAVAEFDQVAQRCGVATLLVGAYARDLFLRSSSNSRLPRSTNDVDFAVMVASWEEFLALRSSLLETKRFASVAGARGGVLHKMVYRDRLEIDFIPFGGLAPEGNLRCWPDDFHQLMDVSGMPDALASAQAVDVGACRVSAITAESFVLLKLLAWNDCPDREKDARDLAYLFREYENLPGKMDALWDPEHLDLIERLPNDHDRQIVRLLGRNVARGFRTEINLKACEILARESSGTSLRLASQMGSHNIEKALEALSDLRDGFIDILQRRVEA